MKSFLRTLEVMENTAKTLILNQLHDIRLHFKTTL